MSRLFFFSILILGFLTVGGAQAVQLQPDHAPGMCLDFLGGDGQIKPCKSLPSQDFTLPRNENVGGKVGTQFKVGGGCVEVGGEGERLKGRQCRDVPSQRWLYYQSTGLLQNPASGLCVDVARASKDSRSAVIGYRCTRAANQRWFAPKLVILQMPPTLRPIYARNMCVDLDESRDRLGLWPCHGKSNQRFTMPNGSTPGQIKIGKKCLSSGSRAPTLEVSEQRCRSGGDAANWNADGTGTIWNRMFKKCLTVDGHSSSQGALIRLQDCVPGASNQIFVRQ